MKKITILVPAYNEEESITLLYDRINRIVNEMTKYEFELLFINDGSKDKTSDIIKQLRKNDKRVSYVNFSRNFGKEIAMLAGFDYAIGDCVIIIDAELQDPPELIPEIVRHWEEGYDDIYAKRNSRKGETWLKKWTSKMYYKVPQSVTRIEIQKDTGDFRLLDRRCVNALKKLRETGRNSKSLFSWIGYYKKAILYDRDVRIAGKTKWNYSKLVDLAIDGITSFTTSPLRTSIFIAIPVLISFIIYLVYIIIYNIFTTSSFNEIQAIILILLLCFGMLFILMGIVGEYLGRIFNESKNRLVYLVDEYNGENKKII